MKIGIDLGTTNSVVAIFEGKKTRVLDNKEGKSMTPSVVAYKGSGFLVGAIAKKRQNIDPLNTIYSVKRLMGRGIKDEEVKEMKKKVPYIIVQPKDGTEDSVAVIINNEEFTPVQVSAEILKKIKKDVEFRTGEEVKDAVITVPAYFSEIQKKATWEAGELAGLNVLAIIDEPTAAAISYGIVEESDAEDAKIALVFDLGGGTFDISVIALSGGSTTQMRLEGDMWLGGDNFDQVIIDKVIKEILEEEGVDATADNKLLAKIKSAAQEAKEILSGSENADVLIETVEFVFETEITRKWFENAIEPLIQRCCALALKAIEGAGFDGPQDIDLVIMAGNSTLIPKVQECVEQMFGTEKVKRKIHPKLCVADGAARKAAIIDENNRICPVCLTANEKDANKCSDCGFEFIMIDDSAGILAFDYGIGQVGDIFNVYYEKDTKYPINPEDRITKTVHTNFSNQRMILATIYGGESAKASENEKQGEVFSVLPHGLPEGTEVRIKLWLDKNGLFELQTFLDTGENLQCIILRGKSDTKTVYEVYTKLTDYSNHKNNLSDSEQKDIENQFEEVLKLLVKGGDENFKQAKTLNDKINIIIVKDPPVPEIDCQAALNIANNILLQYGELLNGTQKYKVREKMEHLDDAIKNERPCDSLAGEMMQLLDELMFEEVNGKKVPSLFGLAMGAAGLVNQAVQKDPAKSQELRLRERLEAALIKLKTGNKNQAMMELMEVMADAQKVIGRGPGFQPQAGLIICRNCGKKTPSNQPKCRNCGEIIFGAGNKSSDILSSFRN
jgi:molecular chaperone DnaK